MLSFNILLQNYTFRDTHIIYWGRPSNANRMVRVHFDGRPDLFPAQRQNDAADTSAAPAKHRKSEGGVVNEGDEESQGNAPDGGDDGDEQPPSDDQSDNASASNGDPGGHGDPASMALRAAMSTTTLTNRHGTGRRILYLD